ncbi:MAG: hypothetical protein EHM58_05730 [Ignavibacteriae bacterium]|nr:MAG: hypothetical protein EHM58_05730 [Ignavibacteriota bacterium]
MAETRQLNITPQEVESGKTMAIIAYFIFFVPLLVEEARNNKFAMYHTEQSILILILNVVGLILGTIGSFVCIGAIFYLINLFAFVLWVMGLINAIQGQAKPVPLVGQYGEKFNLVK